MNTNHDSKHNSDVSEIIFFWDMTLWIGLDIAEEPTTSIFTPILRLEEVGFTKMFVSV
jgi:hypothetical protein